MTSMTKTLITKLFHQCLARIRNFYKTILRRWVTAAWMMVVVVILAGAILSGCRRAEGSPPEHVPKLIIETSVAEDFRELTVETWAEFLNAFWARRNCFGDVRLRATRAINNRAAYDPATATVTVRVPATRAMLKGALVHEWAHHVEFQCEAHQTLRPAFLAAQGLPPDTPWRFDDIPAKTPVSDWPDIPSEQYAETTIEYVLGERQIPTKVRVTRAAIQVVKMWATDQALPQESEQE